MTKIKPRLIARISCQECRRRKTRCNFDGQSDKCSTCARIGTACIFAQKNGVILDIDKVMEENNPHLVHQREKEQRARERERERLNNIPASSVSVPAFGQHAMDMSTYSKSTPSSSFLSGYPNRPSRSNSTSSLFPSIGRSSPTEDLSQVMDRLQLDTFGVAPHTLRSFSQIVEDNDSRETSSGEEFSDIESHVISGQRELKSASPEIKQSNMSKRNSGGSSPGVHHRSSRSRSVPLVDIQPDLIDLYFQHIHPYYLILHKPSFIRRLNDPKDPVPDFLLAAIYAIACNYAPGREQDGRRYFELWLSRLDDTLDKPRLSTIQALLLIIKYQEGVKHTGFYFRTYMYAQMVIVLARELQLHKTSPVNVKLNPESHEVRRRLFWTVFVLDQFISISQGRSMSFNEVEPEADMPCVDNEDPNDPQEIENIHNIVEYIKLAKVNHRAIYLVRKFSAKKVKPEDALQQGRTIRDMMISWRENLPPRLRLASNMSPHTPFVAMIHSIHHICQMMLERCYGEDPNISQHEMSVTARETSTMNATTITVIVDDVYTNHGIVPLTYPIRGCYFTIYCLIAAATVQANDIRRGVNNPIMFKRTLALLNILLRESTATDIEKQIELLKSSTDSSMEGPRNEQVSTSTPCYHDQRPQLKPILPMSQKYGARMNFTSGASPIRMRKISPKMSGPSSTSNIAPVSPAVVSARMATQIPGKSGSSISRVTHGKGSSKICDFGEPLVSAPIIPSSGPSLLPYTSSPFGMSGPADHHNLASGLTNQSGTSTSSARPLQHGSTPSHVQSDNKKLVQQATYKSEPQQQQQQHEDLTQSFKSSPSPDMPSISLSSTLVSSEPQTTTSSDPSLYLHSVPGFVDMNPLSSEFNTFDLAQRQISADNNSQNSTPLLSVAQLLALQEEQQRLHQQQHQQHLPSVPQSGSSLNRLTAAQIQEQHRLNQQRQLLEFQRRQQEQPRSEFKVDNFLSNFSALNNYQQLNSDQQQRELMSMLDSSVAKYQDGFSQENDLDFASTYLQRHQRHHQQQQQQLHNALQHQNNMHVQTPLTPSSITSPGFSQTQFSNSHSLSSQNSSSPSPSPASSGMRETHQGTSSAEIATPILLGQDTPSPETFPHLDMTEAFQNYLCPGSTVPVGLRDLLDDASKIFKFQAQPQEDETGTEYNATN